MKQQNLTSKKLTMEKSLRPLRNSSDIRVVVDYLEVLKEEKYKLLLNTVDEYNTSLLIGELKAYQKLLTVLYDEQDNI